MCIGFKITMKPIHKTILTSFAMSLITSIGAYLIQSRASAAVSDCSYLDPITIDIVATIIALFLILESSFDMSSHRANPVRSQLGRCIRMSIGVAIMTIHVMQFIHK